MELSLGDGSVFKGGTIDYKGPQVDKTTGTLEVRARFPDPEKILRGGQFVRVPAAARQPAQGRRDSGGLRWGRTRG